MPISGLPLEDLMLKSIYDTDIDGVVDAAEGTFHLITAQQVLSLQNSGNVAYTDLDLSSYLPASARAVYLGLEFYPEQVGGGRLNVRENGQTPTYKPHIDSVGVIGWFHLHCIVGCDANQVIEYCIDQLGAGETVSININLWGYFSY